MMKKPMPADKDNIEAVESEEDWIPLVAENDNATTTAAAATAAAAATPVSTPINSVDISEHELPPRQSTVAPLNNNTRRRDDINNTQIFRSEPLSFLGNNSNANNANNSNNSSVASPNPTRTTNSDTKLKTTRIRCSSSPPIITTTTTTNNENNDGQLTNYKLLNRPLSRFAKVFFFNLLEEAWSIHWAIRYGFTFVMSGCTLHLLSLWYIFISNMHNLPRIILLWSVIIGIFSYLYLFQFDNPIGNFWKRINSSQNSFSSDNNTTLNGLFHFLESIDGHEFQHLCLGIFFILPTFIESFILLLLACVVAETSSGYFLSCTFLGIEVLFVFFLYFQLRIRRITQEDSYSMPSTDTSTTSSNGDSSPSHLQSYLYTIGNYKITMMKTTTQNSSISNYKFHAFIYLYISTFLSASMWSDIPKYRMVALGGTFLLASGFVLLHLHSNNNNDDDNNNRDNTLVSDLVRNALRRTLVDVMYDVKDDVAEDEMLQLAMLRWLVDYWSSSRNNDHENESKRDSGDGDGDGDDDDDTKPTDTAANLDTATTMNGNEEPTETSTGDDSSSSRAGLGSSNNNCATISTTNLQSLDLQENNESIGWNALRGMLKLTTDQMYQEIPTTTTTTNPSSQYSSQNSSQQYYSSSQHPEMKNTSVYNLQSILFDVDIDERAKPAVLSYKAAVEGFPPSRNSAIILAFSRRCPAIVSVLYLLTRGYFRSIHVAITLFPFIVLEIMRVNQWLQSCHRSSHYYNRGYDDLQSNEEEEDEASLLVPPYMDTMTILLSEDAYSIQNPGSSLQVWLNVKYSVVALESGLTAMRCVHTAQLATDLAFDVISLSEFAIECKERGLRHGLNLLAMDIFHFHMAGGTQMGTSTTRNDEDNEFGSANNRGRYSKAAMSIIQKGKGISKNVNELVEDSETNENHFGTIINIMSVAVGRGWLWGKNSDTSHYEDTVSAQISNYDEGSHVASDSNTPAASASSSHLKSDLVGPWDDDNDDGNWTPLEPTGQTDHTQTEKELEGTDTDNHGNDTTSSDNCSRDSLKADHNNELNNWIGAGVAVLGATVGGILFANAVQHRPNDSRRRNTKSTVVIEEIDED